MNSSTKYSQNGFHKYEFVMSLFLNEAIASDNKTCLVGGIERDLNSNGTCPVSKDACDKTNPETFRCGSIFSEKCVKRIPLETVSKLCYEASAGDPMSAQDYEQSKDRLEEMYSKTCVNDSNLAKLQQEHVAACHYFRVKMDKLNAPLENTLREDLQKCYDDNATLKDYFDQCQKNVVICETKCSSTAAKSPTWSGCSIKNINMSVLRDLSGIQMFQDDPKYRRLLESRPSNFEAINVYKDSGSNNKICFEFKINERAASFARFDNGGAQTKCLDNPGVLFEDGKAYVPALQSRKHNYITFDQNCRMGTDRLKRIPKEAFKRGTASE